jgi:hypothetical protein
MSELFATGGVLGGAALATYGLKLLNDVVGPSVKSVGTVFGDFVDYRMRNWVKIGEHAKKLQKASSSDGESVSPRVVNKILEDATWYDEPVMQAYSGGLLTSARSESGGDDQSVYYLDLLQRMPATAVRLHHVLYAALRDAGRKLPPPKQGQLKSITWKVPVALLVAEAYPGVEMEAVTLSEDLGILSSLNLIFPFEWGFEKEVGGRVLTGSPWNPGIALFASAHGRGRGDQFASFLSDDLPEFDPPGPRIPEGARYMDLTHVA